MGLVYPTLSLMKGLESQNRVERLVNLLKPNQVLDIVNFWTD